MKLGDNSMENKFVKVTFAKNGTFSVLDKASGKVLDGQNYFTEIGDKGNEYEFMPEGDLHDTLSDTAKISVEKVEKDLITFKVVNSLMQRDGNAVSIESLVTLYENKKGIEKRDPQCESLKSTIV